MEYWVEYPVLCSRLLLVIYFLYNGVYRSNAQRRVWGLKSVIPLHGKFIITLNLTLVLFGGSEGKEFACNSGDLGLIPGLEGLPGGKLGTPLQYSCLENPHGQRNLAGYSPWGHKDSDMTERLSTNKWMPLISKVIYRFITISIQISTALLKKQKSQP